MAVVRPADGARIHALGRTPVRVRAVRRGLHQAQLAEEARHDSPRLEALRLRHLHHAVCIHSTVTLLWSCLLQPFLK